MNSSIILKICSKRERERLEKKIKLLGSNSKLNIITFLNTRVIFTILFFLVLFFLKVNLLLVTLLTIIMFFGYEYVVLDYRIKKRGKKLDYEALFFFEVLTLSLEGGRNLKGALELTCNNIKSDLSDEFKYALNMMNYGKTLPEALKTMKERISSQTVNEVILNMTETNVYGNKIIKVIDTQVEYLREKKLLNVRGEVAKMPLKISVVSVLIFIPILLLLLLGPVILDYLN